MGSCQLWLDQKVLQERPKEENKTKQTKKLLCCCVHRHPFTPPKLSAFIDEAKTYAAEYTLQTLGVPTEGTEVPPAAPAFPGTWRSVQQRPPALLFFQRASSRISPELTCSWSLRIDLTVLQFMDASLQLGAPSRIQTQMWSPQSQSWNGSPSCCALASAIQDGFGPPYCKDPSSWANLLDFICQRNNVNVTASIRSQLSPTPAGRLMFPVLEFIPNSSCNYQKSLGNHGKHKPGAGIQLAGITFTVLPSMMVILM